MLSSEIDLWIDQKIGHRGLATKKEVLVYILTKVSQWDQGIDPKRNFHLSKEEVEKIATTTLDLLEFSCEEEE